jgi:predicted ATPase/DNA-binding SARP family transcriptional activator
MTGDSCLRFGVLGTFRVERDGQQVDLGPRLQRTLLAILLVDAGHVVPVDRLIDLLWRDGPPAAAIASVQAYVSQLRRVLEPGRLPRAPATVLVTQEPGYVLRVDDQQVDALRFQAMARQAHNDLASGQPAAAAARLDDALALWRGEPLAEFAAEPWAVPAVTRLTETYDLAAEDRVGAWLALGRPAEAATELEAMVAARPLRERRWEQLIVATYRSGRQADALRAYQRCRTVLAGELGLEPGPELRRLEAAVLAQDPALEWQPPAPPPGRPPDDLAAGPPAGPPPAPGTPGGPAFPNNLPAQLAAFVGRERELAEIRELVRASRLVTLTGAGGSGKTRLSLQVAAQLPGGSADGAWLVELAAVSGEEAVAPAICEVLGTAIQPGRPALDALLDALAPQDILIVLDNCEHLIGACAKSAYAILRHCPRVRLVATSREPLGISGEAVYRVPPLSLPGPGEAGLPTAVSSDAVALFADRAQAQGTGLVVDEETAPLIVSICRRLDGLPLAIELAAARLRSLSLGGLAERLDQRFRLLTGGDRAAPRRQQTLRATVEWSYSLLSGPEQVLLGRLAVFAGSFDLEAAEASCSFGDIEAFDVADLLGSLVDKSLVTAEPAGPALRYRLLETIRQFAAERLAGAGEEAAAAAAHGAHYLSVAETAAPHLEGPGQGAWLARLDADRANLRRAAEQAAGRPDGTGQVLRLGVALRRYWLARDRGEEAMALLMPALDRPEARADPQLYGSALATAALAGRYTDAARAGQLSEQAIGIARRLGSRRLLIESLIALSAARYHAGEPERGVDPGREAVQLAREAGDEVLLGESLTGYLHCYALTDPAHAGPLFTEAIAGTLRTGDHLFAYHLTNYAGVHALRAGDIPAARAYLLQAADAMHAIKTEDPHLSINMGWVLRQDGNPGGARDSFRGALRRSRRNGDHYGIAYASLGLACLAADTGDGPRAAVLHGVAQAFLSRTGLPWEELEARYRRDSLDQVCALIGQEEFERAHARGMAIRGDEAFSLVSA